MTPAKAGASHSLPLVFLHVQCTFMHTDSGWGIIALHLHSGQQRMDPGLWGMISQSEQESDALDLLSNDRAKSAVKHRQTALQVRGM